jgi:hypothetical protein
MPDRSGSTAGVLALALALAALGELLETLASIGLLRYCQRPPFPN